MHEDHVVDLDLCVDRITHELFPDRFKGQELHVHDIYKGQKEFSGITLGEIQETLDCLYGSFLDVDFSTITIVIDKERWFNSKHFKYDVLQSAYTFLVERFERFLQKNNSKGLIRIDKVSNKPNALNAKDQKILNIINNLRAFGSYWSPIRGLVEPPLFLQSSACHGLQVADAIAYGTNLYLKGTPRSDRCREAILRKAQRRQDNRIDGYGISIFPR